jgi:DNA-binding FadR family transcriptional regulator
MPAKSESTNRLSGLSASIVGTLKQRIVGWQYPPEHRLTEESLCREFGVSRSPVREAAGDLGDSAITETAGLGGFAMEAAPAIVKSVGGTPADALGHTLAKLEGHKR